MTALGDGIIWVQNLIPRCSQIVKLYKTGIGPYVASGM